MYANFARSGDPTVSGVAWEKYNTTHRAYLKVDTSPELKASFNPRRMSFWNDYYPKLEQVKFDANKEVVNDTNKEVVNDTNKEVVNDTNKEVVSGAKDIVTMGMIGTVFQVVFSMMVFMVY